MVRTWEIAYVDEGLLDDPPAEFDTPKRPGNPLGEGVVDACIVFRWFDYTDIRFSTALMARHSILARLDVSCKDWNFTSRSVGEIRTSSLVPNNKEVCACCAPSDVSVFSKNSIRTAF